MSRFIKFLALFVVICLIGIIAVQRMLFVGPRNKMAEAQRYVQTLTPILKADPRFENITFDGVSWSGPGHPVYIAVLGTVRTEEDWLAFSNLVHQTPPPVEMSLSTVHVAK